MGVRPALAPLVSLLLTLASCGKPTDPGAEPQPPATVDQPKELPPRSTRKRPIVLVPAPTPARLAPEVMQAWAARGFQLLWITEPSTGFPVPGWPGWPVASQPMPVMLFRGRPGTLAQSLAGLPDVGRPFGLEADYHTTDDDIAAIAGVKNLTYLSLTGQNVTAAGLRRLAPLRGLTALSLAATSATDATIKALAAIPDLQALDLSRTKVTDAVIKELTALKGLRVLVLRETLVGDGGMADLAPLPLTFLMSSGARVTGAALPHIGACKTLTGLRVDCEFTAAQLGGLASLTELRFLSCGRRFADLSAAPELAELAPLAELKSLATLVLPQVTDEVLAILRKAGKLHAFAGSRAEHGRRATGPGDVVSLDLSGTLVTGQGLTELASLENLDTLTLQRAQVSDGMRHLLSLKNLAALSVSTLSGGVPSDLKELAAHGGLELLDLSNGHLSPGAARGAASIPYLTTLVLGHAADTDLRELPALKHLAVLSVAGAGVTDEGMWDLAKIGTLRELHLSRTQVADKGVKELAALPRLTRLYLTDSRLTPVQFEEFRRALPRCEVMSVAPLLPWPAHNLGARP